MAVQKVTISTSNNLLIITRQSDSVVLYQFAGQGLLIKRNTTGFTINGVGVHLYETDYVSMTTMATALNSMAAVAALTGNPDVYSLPVNAYGAAGSEIISEPLHSSLTRMTTALTLVDQAIFFISHYLPKARTIHGVATVITNNGSHTSNNYNGVGLYKWSAGTWQRVAISTDDGNIWKNSQGLLKKPFSANYNADAGLYAVGALWCRSAVVSAPAIGASPAANVEHAQYGDFTNSFALTATLVSQTSLPSSVAASALNKTATTRPFLALY